MSIAYQVVGGGPVDLILVSSWITNVDENWDEPSYARLLERLGSFGRLIHFDKRGTGLSDRVAELQTLEERMDDVRAVMDAAGSRRAVLIGSTEGGAMCALFAATYPERTAALIMYGAYAKRLKSPDYPWGPSLEERDQFYATMLRQWGGPAVLEYLAPSMIEDERFCRWWAGFLRRSASPHAAVTLTQMNTGIDIRGVLGAIRVPTLVLHRTGDVLCPVEGARFLAAHIPGARLVELPGRDHLPFVGDVDAIVDAIQEFVTGARPSTAPDRVLTTLMFTEIVGTVEMALNLDDRQWHDRMDAHDRLIRGLLAEYRGREIRKTVAGFLAAFDGPARAIRCASEIISAARAMGLTVRAGLHTGECEERDGDLSGVAVHIAARVLARAGPGDILVSSTVRDLVAGSGIAFEEIGVLLLAGPGSAWHLFRVTSSPGAHDFKSPAEAAASTSGQSRLSRRERQIAALLAQGMSNREIAEALSISVATVERHIANVFNKLGYHSRAQVAAWAVEQGLSRVDDLS